MLAAFLSAAAPHGARTHAYYAAKAFLSADVARWMHEEGLRMDVATGGELALALAAGVHPEMLGLHGNDKSDAELQLAVEAGIGSIVLDSAEEVDRVADAARRAHRVQAVRLRVNSGVHASTHEYLATAREDQKFGVALAQVPGVVAAIRSRPELRLLGLHSHIGSQITGLGGFAEAARRLLAVHRDLLAGRPGARAEPRRRLRHRLHGRRRDGRHRCARGRRRRHRRGDVRRARHPDARPRDRARSLDRRPGGGHRLHRGHREGRGAADGGAAPGDRAGTSPSTAA